MDARVVVRCNDRERIRDHLERAMYSLRFGARPASGNVPVGVLPVDICQRSLARALPAGSRGIHNVFVQRDVRDETTR